MCNGITSDDWREAGHCGCLARHRAQPCPCFLKQAACAGATADGTAVSASMQPCRHAGVQVAGAWRHASMRLALACPLAFVARSNVYSAQRRKARALAQAHAPRLPKLPRASPQGGRPSAWAASTSDAGPASASASAAGAARFSHTPHVCHQRLQSCQHRPTAHHAHIVAHVPEHLPPHCHFSRVVTSPACPSVSCPLPSAFPLLPLSLRAHSLTHPPTHTHLHPHPHTSKRASTRRFRFGGRGRGRDREAPNNTMASPPLAERTSSRCFAVPSWCQR